MGHSLSIAIGIAKDLKLKKLTSKVVVLMGDGELNEGSNWESLLIASAYKLDNLVIIIDRNRIQANLTTEELIPLESLELKFLSFNLAVKKINGHNFNEIHNAFSEIPFINESASVIIAETIRGHGIEEIQNRTDKWFCTFSDNQAKELISKII